MVQWFKGLILHIMGYFRGWRPALTRDVFSFNHEQLVREMTELSASLYELRHEQSWKVVRELIVRARNVQAIDAARLTPSDKSAILLAHHQGRVQAFSDLLANIDNSMDQMAYEQRMAAREQKVAPGTRKMTTPFRKRPAGNTAGAAI